MGRTDIEAIDEYYTFVCSDAHWCPWGFRYNSRSGACQPLQAACYSTTDETMCNSIYGTDNRDVWEADSGCTKPNPEGEGVDGVYNEACVYTGTFGGVDYFFYQDILVDQ